MADRTWREQYDRMRRWYERVSETRAIDDHLVDDFYAFFVCCWHLKDWIKADDSVGQQVRDAVEDFVNRNLWLRLCADLANGSKHMTLDSPRLDAPAVLERGLALNLFRLLNPFPVVPVLRIPMPGGSHQPLRCATSCIEAWDGFLRDHGLLEPQA